MKNQVEVVPPLKSVFSPKNACTVVYNTIKVLSRDLEFTESILEWQNIRKETENQWNLDDLNSSMVNKRKLSQEIRCYEKLGGSCTSTEISF